MQECNHSNDQQARGNAQPFRQSHEKSLAILTGDADPIVVWFSGTFIKSWRKRCHGTKGNRFRPTSRAIGSGCGRSAANGPTVFMESRWRDRKSTRLNSSHLGISYA